jgi:hypothetical protein
MESSTTQHTNTLPKKMESSTTQPTNTLPKKKSQKKKNSNKKRSREAIVMDQQQSYCDRLLHQCRKDLHKHAKVCKNFESQKLIRKGKTSEQLLSTWRNLPLEPVLQECFRRLGALDLLEKEQQKEDDNTPASNEAVDEEDIERILQNKRMREALEQWSVKVTEYRKWCARHVEENNQSSRKKQKKAPEVADAGPIDNSLFVTLNEDEVDDDDDDEDDEDNKEPEEKTKKKKNRVGQKARKAKFVEAQRLQGIGIEQVPRPPKARVESNKNAPVPKEKEEELHPSWEARKSLKSNIVAFQGKKITFG